MRSPVKGSVVFLALTSALGGAALYARRRLRAAAHPNLSAVDDAFHSAYGALRSTQAHAAPVLVLFQGSIILFEGGREHAFAATASATELLKAVAHLPIGIYAALQRSPSPLDPARVASISQLRARCDAAFAEIAALAEESREEAAGVLQASRALLHRTLARHACDAHTLEDFAARLGPALLRLTDAATQLELDALHTAVEQALALLPTAARAQLEVVVAGAHQARARSLPLQYFQKRFDEAPGEERRVTYAEAADTAQEAHALVGTRRLDRLLAQAFFGDEKRLQRDVLGDSAAHRLARLELAPIARAQS